MTVSEQIDALLAEAAPLRLLPDDEAEIAGLPKLVDRINALRAMSEDITCMVYEAMDAAPSPPKRGPGRPKAA